MQRQGALLFCAAIVIASFCCPAPLRGIEMPQQMSCPITGEECNTGDADCQETPAPVASSLPSLPTVVPDAVAVVVSPTIQLVPPRAIAPHEQLFWLLPTRTIQLRI